MSSASILKFGTIGWHDLTVPNAVEVSHFYENVVGWKKRPEDMGGYNDFSMIAAASGETVAGVCHAQGLNAELPPQWLMYIIVENVDWSAEKCVELGGQILVEPRLLGAGRFCVIRDTAGAVCALYQEKS